MALQEIRTYDVQCKARCGVVCVVDDGRLVEVRPDPEHPNSPLELGLCPKGKALPELLYHPDRLKEPLRRTAPKSSDDPGWERISWDEALKIVAEKLLDIRKTSGAESVVFHRASPGGSAASDFDPWFFRLAFLFGTPNISSTTHICNWHKDVASRYTYGSSIPEPDFDQTACILLWGHNPQAAWRGHYRKILQALDRGAKLIVADPRRIPLAERADLWLPVRPGTDGCLALGFLRVLLEEGLFDREFVRTWTTAPFLVREDTGRFLRARDLDPAGSEDRFAVWDEGKGGPASLHPLDPPEALGIRPSLSAQGTATLHSGERVSFRTAWDHLLETVRQTPLPETAQVTGVPADQIRRAARMFAILKPSCYYTYNGVEQHPTATQTNRAISLLFALTGQFDAPGANVLFPRIAAESAASLQLLPPGQREKSLARDRFPLGPPAGGAIPPYEVYRAILTGRPYPIRALVSFGGNILLSTSDTLEGRRALEKLEFFALTELFETPAARFADILLPASTFLESMHVKTTFEQGADTSTFVQLRKQVVPPLHESRPDMRIIFELARRLGLGGQFWEGDLRAAFNAQLAPAGLSVEDLERNPGGIFVPLPVEFHKYRAKDPQTGRSRGFRTATGRVEIYLETFHAKGYSPVPDFRPAPAEGDAKDYPLILTTAKVVEFCHGQHRAVPSLRRRVPAPYVEIHPQTARGLEVRDGEWVRLETPLGGIRVRARLTEAIRPDVVCTQHGWWQECRALNLPGYDAFSEEGANINRIIGSRVVDPVSGATANRSHRCRVVPLRDEALRPGPDGP
ncbi:MAG: molybdopterin-dependent oxidoreductase [Candidatus Tectomicrobia bacterium]|nr:molybdopterin-dependent oxidoreductase [Candidatus Tectomicrobia bacterium]